MDLIPAIAARLTRTFGRDLRTRNVSISTGFAATQRRTNITAFINRSNTALITFFRAPSCKVVQHIKLRIPMLPQAFQVGGFLKCVPVASGLSMTLYTSSSNREACPSSPNIGTTAEHTRWDEPREVAEVFY